MAKFRKKPVVIDAWEWTESLAMLRELEALGLKPGSYSGHRDQPDLCKRLTIQTLEGSLHVSPGDWIIRGIKGEFYPCKPEIFTATYDGEDTQP